MIPMVVKMAIVEQAMRIADYVYVIQRGRVVLAGARDEVAGRVQEIEASYLADGPSDDVIPDQGAERSLSAATAAPSQTRQTERQDSI